MRTGTATGIRVSSTAALTSKRICRQHYTPSNIHAVKANCRAPEPTQKRPPRIIGVASQRHGLLLLH